MADLQIKCSNCNLWLKHDCHTGSVQQALRKLYSWVPECTPRDVVKEAKRCGVEKEAREYPFLSEAFLYPLLGKEDARTLSALVNSLVRAMGIDPNQFDYHELLFSDEPTPRQLDLVRWRVRDIERELQEAQQEEVRVAKALGVKSRGGLGG